MIQASRRSFITGLVSLVAAPAIVRAGSLMPVKVMVGMDFGIQPSTAFIFKHSLPAATWRCINNEVILGSPEFVRLMREVIGEPDEWPRALK